MTDYRNPPLVPERNKKRQKFFEIKNKSSVNEKTGMSTSLLESDSVVDQYEKYSNFLQQRKHNHRKN